MNNTTVFFTGFSQEKRQQYEQLAQDKFGYKVSQDLNADVDYLIYLEPNELLFSDAHKLNIECLSEEMFLGLVG